jgi:hypothetical protein
MTTRRKFIYSAGVLGVAALGYAALGPMRLRSARRPAELPNEWLWVGAAELINGPRGNAIKQPTHGALVGINPTVKGSRSIAVNFLPHDIAICPADPTRAVTTMKWGPPGAVVDIVRQKIIFELVAPDQTRFYGHSAWAKDGEIFYCVVNNDAARQSELLVYSGTNYRLLDRIKLSGSSPHQVRRAEDTSELIVMNQHCETGYSRADFVDSTSHKINKSWDVRRNSYSHFAYSAADKRLWAGGFVGSHEDIQESLFETVADNGSTPIDIPTVESKVVKGENLSLNLGQILGRKVVGFTISGGKFYALYDIDRKEYMTLAHDTTMPKGLDFSRTTPNIVYVSGGDSTLRICDLSNGQFDVIATLPFGNGSHLSIA